MNVGGDIGGREVLEEASADDNEERIAEWHTMIMRQWSVIVKKTPDRSVRNNIVTELRVKPELIRSNEILFQVKQSKF